VREQAALAVVEREAGFVAGAFDAENEHGVGQRNGICAHKHGQKPPLNQELRGSESIAARVQDG
jgi:hypothetical protein